MNNIYKLIPFMYIRENVWVHFFFNFKNKYKYFCKFYYKYFLFIL